MDNSSLMNRENKKRQLRRQIVPPRYQTEEESEQAIRNAHKKTVRKRLAVLAVVAVLLGGAAFGIYYYDRYHSFYDYQVVWEKSLAEENQEAAVKGEGSFCEYVDFGDKVAYAHHMDDMIETMVLSMIFEGRFYSFSPVTFLDRMELTVIRPMMYVSEAEVKGFRNKYNLPVVENPCPVDGVTKRQYAKDLVRQINLDHPGAKKRMFTAILDGNIPGWPEKTEHERKGHQ